MIKKGKDLVLRDTIAPEVIHDHKINDHCDHFLCFMRRHSVAMNDYTIPFDSGRLGVWIGKREKSLSLDTSHQKDLAVTGHPNAGTLEHIVGGEIGLSKIEVSVPSVTPGFAPASGSSYTATAGETHTGEVRNSAISFALLYVNGNYIKQVWGSPTATRLLLRYTFPEGVSASYTLGTYVYARKGKSFRLLGYYSYKVEVNAPQTVPSMPLLLSAEPNDGAVRLSWKPPADDGNSDITHYEYRYGIGASVTVDKYKSWTSMKKAMATFLVSPLL